MTYKAIGIIIRKKDIREADRLFTIYTREYGKIEAMAQGVRKLSSKLSGNLELLNHAVFTIAKGKQLDRIATVDIKQSFETAKGSLDRLTVALAAMDLIDVVVRPQSVDHVLFETISDLLETLNVSDEISHTSLLRLFTIKVAIILGYRPNIKSAEAILQTVESQSLKDMGIISANDPLVMRIFRQSKTALLERPLASSVFTDYFEKRSETSRRKT